MSIWNNVELVTKTIESSDTRSEVLNKLQRSLTTASYRRLKAFELEYGVDTSHYTPHASKHRKSASNDRRTYTNEEIFVEQSTISQSVLRRRIIRDEIIPYICKKCGMGDVWRDESITLHLEHINGVHTDNRISNLCFLCPNCHSQTPTYAGRNVNTKPKTKMLRDDHKKRLRAEADERNQPLVEKILNSDIDFTKYGWVKQAAQLIGKNPQKMKQWMLRYMPDFYRGCYKRC